MSSEPAIAATDPHGDGNLACWCCGTMNTPLPMVHLGEHPEGHLCLRCAHFVHQQAWQIQDEGEPGPAAAARARFRNLRAEVVHRGWHQNSVIGGGLRWLGRYLP